MKGSPVIPAARSRNSIGVLHCGLSAPAKALLTLVFDTSEVLEVEYESGALTDLSTTLSPGLIAIGPPPHGWAVIEVAKLLRRQYPDVPIFYLASSRQEFNRGLLKKNGITEVFLLPREDIGFDRRLRDERSLATGGQQHSFKAVKLINLQPGIRLDFDTSIRLPANREYVRVSAAGDELDEAILRKLRAHQVGATFVERAQLGKFYGFCARQLRALHQPGLASATERAERLREAVRDIMAGVLNDAAEDGSFEEGQSLAAGCQSIVRQYIVDAPNGAREWYAQVLQAAAGGADTRRHAANVSTYAVLFGLGLGVPNCEEIGIAGLLIDIGAADLPRRVVLPERVMRAIQQHHERFDRSDRICIEAQLLGIADEFDTLTAPGGEATPVAPLAAIRRLWRQSVADPSRGRFDPDLVQQIIKLFPQEAEN